MSNNAAESDTAGAPVGPPSPDRVVAATLPAWSASSTDRRRAHELVERLLAESVSLDEFLIGAPAAGLDRIAAARLAAACAAMPTPGADIATGSAAGAGAGSEQGAGSRAGGTLRVALWTSPEGLDPALATTRTSRLLTEQLYSTLTSLDADARPYPDLAEWIEVAEDAQSYTFGLRPGVKFHDGTEVTAEDVAFSLDRIHDLGEGYHFEPWTVTMAGAEVVDRRTVRLRLTQPTGPMLTWLAFCGSGIVPRALARAGHDLDHAPIGSGPFRLAGGSVGGPEALAETLRLERHPSATADGRDGPWLDALEFVTIPDDRERAAAVIEGRVDMDALVGTSVWPNVVSAPNVATSRIGDGRWHWLMVNCQDPLLGDRRVRQAVAHAIDRQALVDRGMDGLATPILGGVMAPWSWASAPDVTPFEATAAPDRARALLADAGTVGARISVAANAALPLTVRHGQLIVDQLNAAGFEARLDALDAAAWDAAVQRGGTFQLALSYWGSPINDPDDFVYMGFRSGARFDTGICGSPELDELLDAGRGSLVQATRADAYRAMQALATEDLPLIPTVMPLVLRAWSSRVRGVVPLRNAQLKTLRRAWLAD